MVIKLDGTKNSVCTVDDYNSSASDDCRIVVLSSRDVTIIRSFLYPCSLWVSRFGSWVGVNRFSPVGGNDFAEYLDTINALDYKLSEGAMSDCAQLIKEGLQAIAGALQAIASKPCCNVPGSNSGIIGTTPEGNISYGTQEGKGKADNEGQDPPEGFNTWDEYYCSGANLLADGIIASLHNLSLLSLVNITGLGVLIGAAIAGFIVLPAAAIPIMIAAMVGLGLSIGVLSDLSEYLQQNREELVCAIFNSDTAVAAQDAVAGVIDEALAALAVASELHPLIRTIALVLASTDTINALYDGTLKAQYPNADCDNCQPPAISIRQFNGSAQGVGDVISPDDGWVTLTATVEQGYRFVGVNVVTGSCVVEWRNISGWTATGYGNDFQIRLDTYAEVLHSSNNPEAFAAASANACNTVPTGVFVQYAISSGTAMTIEVRAIVCP